MFCEREKNTHNCNGQLLKIVMQTVAGTMGELYT